MKRESSVERKTKETDIKINLKLDLIKDSNVDSGIPFLDHMLKSMSRHGRFYLDLKCLGDTIIDDHHSAEDIGITLGTAFKKALGVKSGINRFGDINIPMDETLTLIAIDLSGRSFFKYEGISLNGYVGKYSEELTIEFLKSFAGNLGCNLHVKVFHGENKHHIHESIFKGLGIALYKATMFDEMLDGKLLTEKGIY
jgi:imidazoleglycerol-phosphate dehydratase